MKKNILLVFLLLFSFQQSAYPKDIVVLSAPLSGIMEKSEVAKMQEQINQSMNDDQIIAFYLTVPYEKRQYIFPMIHIMPFISHKIKTHPEILAWKNKKPTIIAPELKDFAEQHLQNLSPAFYAFMDPDFWKAPPKEDLFGKEKLLKEPFPPQSEKTVDYTYQTVKELFKIADNKKSDYFKTDLIEKDIIAFSNVIANLDDFKPKNINTSLLSATIPLLQKQPHRSLADPFLMYVYTLENINESDSFDKYVQKYGFKNGRDFALKADRITKAYKVLSLNLLIAIQIAQQKSAQHINKPKKSDFLKPDIPIMNMYTRIHSATPGDVYFVKKYQKQLSNIFKTKFVNYGIMISVD